MEKVGIRGYAWLLCLAFAVLLLERGVPHHCSSAGHQEQKASGTASLSLDCPLCDLALPSCEAAVRTLPPSTQWNGVLEEVFFPSLLAICDLGFEPVRGPPIV